MNNERQRDSNSGGATRGEHRGPPAPVLIALVVVCVGVFAYLAQRFYGSTIDDVYITYRYAQNFANGDGLVFNPGDRPRAEGLTSLAYGVLLSAAPRLGFDIVSVSRWLGLLVGLPTAVAIGLVARAGFGRERISWGVAAALGCAAYLTDPFIAGHAVSGMETAPAALAVAVFGLLGMRSVLEDRSTRAAAVLGLVALLPPMFRPELTLLVSLFLMLGFCVLPRARRSVLIATGVFVVCGACYFLARYSYYEMLLPLPFYHKQRMGTSGLGPFLEYTRDTLVLIPFIIAALALAIRDWRSERARAVLVLALAVFVQVAYYITIIHIMGLGYRFFQPINALVVALGLIGVFALVAWARARWRRLDIAIVVGMAGVLTLGNLVTLPKAQALFVVRLGVAEQRGVVRALAIRDAAAGQRYSMAINDCGRIPYYTDFDTIDLAGLNSRALARNRTRGTVYREMERARPDFIVLVATRPHGVTAMKAWEYLDAKALARLGYHYEGHIEGRPTYFFLFFARDGGDYDDFFARLEASGVFVAPANKP